MFIIAQISKQTDAPTSNGLLELNGAHNLPKGIGALRQAAATNHSLPVSDVYIFDVAALSQTIRTRLQEGDEFDLVWSADAVSGVDFTKEDAKFVVDVTSAKNSILGNTVDNTDVTITVFKANGSTIQPINGTKNVSILMPVAGIVLTPVVFANGVGTFTFKTPVAGQWQFPSHKKRLQLNGGTLVRVRTFAVVEVLQVF